MFKLKTGYFLTGIITGLILLFTFFSQLPDGKLHIVFCDVGQGDAAYIRFPDGRDMLIDGGPGGQTPRVIGCLSRHMSLFDRQIDIILLSHPQEDHLGGVQEVFKRYKVKQFIRSPAVNTTEGFQLIEKFIAEKHIPQDIAEAGEIITVDAVHFSVLWPDIPKAVAEQCGALPFYGCNNVLGVADVNDASVVLRLRYGTFDVLFPGDADGHVDPELTIHPLYLPDAVEVLKVPHHGSKTGMTDGFLRWLGPIKLAVISVGKNTYGHPSQETITRLDMLGTQVVRTDQKGDIEIISDGTHWEMLTEKR